MPQRVMVLLTVLTLATVLLAGCGGQDTPVEQAEEEAGLEEVVAEEEVTQAPPRDAEEAESDRLKKQAADAGKGGADNTIRYDPNSSSSLEEQKEMLRMECQLYKAGGGTFKGTDRELESVERNLEESGLNDEIVEEVLAGGGSIGEILARRGYTCTDEDIAALQKLQRDYTQRMIERMAESAKEHPDG